MTNTDSPRFISRYLEGYPSSDTSFSRSLLVQDGNLRTSARKSLKFETTRNSELGSDDDRDSLVSETMRSSHSQNKHTPSKGYNTDKVGLDHSLAAKEDILTKMQDSPMHQNKSLSLLHDHIKDMTSLVRRLSRDVERCEAGVSSNTVAITTITARLVNLENNNIVSNNVDSRINRCDVGITEIVREIKECNRNINKVKQTTDAQTHVQSDKHRTAEARFTELERIIHKLDSDQHQQITLLKGQTKELGSVSMSLEKGLSSDMSQLKETCLTRVVQLVSQVEERCTLQIEKREEKLDAVNDTLTKAIDELSRDIKKIQYKEDQIHSQISQSEADNNKIITRLRGECMSGFKTLQESVDTMHSILDSKIHLVEEDLRAEIRKAMKTVVVT